METQTNTSISIAQLRILVVDDNQMHRRSAQARLGHAKSLTVVGSYDEAKVLLAGDRYARRSPQSFDMVLLDLLMPTSTERQGKPELWVGQEMPVGMFLAILAAMRGAKYVAVYTDSNHHDHPASAALDSLQESAVQVNGAKMIFCNSGLHEIYHESDLLNPVEHSNITTITVDGCWRPAPGYGFAKRWDQVAEQLLGE